MSGEESGEIPGDEQHSTGEPEAPVTAPDQENDQQGDDQGFTEEGAALADGVPQTAPVINEEPALGEQPTEPEPVPDQPLNEDQVAPAEEPLQEPNIEHQPDRNINPEQPVEEGAETEEPTSAQQEETLPVEPMSVLAEEPAAAVELPLAESAPSDEQSVPAPAESPKSPKEAAEAAEQQAPQEPAAAETEEVPPIELPFEGATQTETPVAAEADTPASAVPEETAAEGASSPKAETALPIEGPLPESERPASSPKEKAASSKPTSPKPTSPKIRSPKPTSPKVSSPKPTSPKVNSPKAASPEQKPASPKAASPVAAAPEQVVPAAAAAHATVDTERRSPSPSARVEAVPPADTPPKRIDLGKLFAHHRNELAVKVKQPDGSEKLVRVTIERAELPKYNWGGYRHKRTGVEYYHAAVQTNPRERPPHPIPRFSRDAQTVQVKQVVQQTFADRPTQMTTVGVYVSNVNDRLMTPQHYVTADAFHSNRLEKVVVIQRWVRRWLAQRYVARLRADRKAREEWARHLEEQKLKEREERVRREYERRMNPKTRADFDLLYHHLEQWRLEETRRIHEQFADSDAARKAQLCMLLDRETELLSSIERQKIDASRDWKQSGVASLLAQSSAPKEWVGRDGRPNQMETPFTLRAKQLKELYECINMRYVTRDERLDVLLSLKHTITEHQCTLTREIGALADREADLLLRDFNPDKLEGLRKRISTLFLQYVRTPMFNPEVARLLRVPQDPMTLKREVYFCGSCQKYLPSAEFPLSTLATATGRCRACIELDNRARARQDLTNYRYMLRALRKREEEYNDGAKVAYILQESDIRYLVEQVWGSKSIFSGADDLFELVLLRWDRRDEWSPWNTVLLTKEEVPAHERAAALEATYCREFLAHVRRLHTLARQHFARLPALAAHLQLNDRYALRVHSARPRSAAEQTDQQAAAADVGAIEQMVDEAVSHTVDELVQSVLAQ